GNSDFADLPAGDVESSDLEGRTFLSTDVAGETLVEDTRISIVFTADSLSAVAGCNTMSGGYTLDNNTLKVPTLAAPRMACEPELMTQDEWVSALLTSEPRISLKDNELIIAHEKTSVTLRDRRSAAKASALDGSSWSIATLETGGSTANAPDGAYMTF